MLAIMIYQAQNRGEDLFCCDGVDFPLLGALNQRDLEREQLKETACDCGLIVLIHNII